MNDDMKRRIRGALPPVESVSVDDIVHRAGRIRRKRVVGAAVAVCLLALIAVGGIAILGKPRANVRLNTAGEAGLSVPGAVTATSSPSPGPWQVVTSADLDVELLVPSSWQLDTTFPLGTRYKGQDGWVLLSARGFSDPNMACEAEANHIGHPYGSNPSVVTITVAGRAACTVAPSADAPLDYGFPPAEMAVSYPHPLSSYGSFELFADAGHIRALAASVEFIGAELETSPSVSPSLKASASPSATPLPPRTPGEEVGIQDTVALISRTESTPNATQVPQFSVTVTDTAAVAKLAQIFNGLKTTAANFSTPCQHPATKSSIIIYSVEFARSASAPPDLGASLMACSPVMVGIGANPGTSAQALDDNSAQLATALAQLLGITGEPYTALGH